ncbi:transglycosylase domain-containing protein [Reichenbachiella versicolor]|uniref:transglycosylase domain-containing protein n=1 Tax=Reichenbachiella versicolor TaxID=1821036 RepID=UPI001FE81D5D|nr:transglycosylase domain-containing protein [Reichenbachiella versicolor]
MSSIKKEKQKKYRRLLLIKVLIRLVFALLAIVFLFFCSIYVGLFGVLPNKEDLKKISNAQSTIIKDHQGFDIGKFFLIDRTSVTYDKIPQHLIEALVSTEDSRFFSHHGLDYRSWGRVLVKTIIMQQRSGGGGSTISQQLAKNLFPRERYTKFDLAISKIKEVITAYRLESLYSKEQILTLYLNTVSFPDNTYGIESASQRFFRKSVNQLSLLESATLIGSLKANHTYNPRLFPDKSQSRRNTVLALMVKHGFLSQEQFTELKTKSTVLDYNSRNKRMVAPYFLEQVKKEAKDIIKRNNLDVNIHTDGLIVHTTLDSKMQRLAEQGMIKHMSSLQKQFEKNWGKEAIWFDKDWRYKLIINSRPYKNWEQQGLSSAEILEKMKRKYGMTWLDQGKYKSVVASQIDSLMHYVKMLNAGSISIHGQSGAIKTWLGGIDFNTFKYDHIEQSKRQVGSVFKPFVYAAALENGKDPCDHISAKTVTYKNFEEWTPSNDSDDYEDKFLSMQYALSKSINTVAVKLMEDVGVARVVDLAHMSGIESILPEVPSLALGTAQLSMIELAKAYTIFTNGGVPVTPYMVESIEDKNGKVLYRYKADEGEKVINDYTYAIMKELLKSVTSSDGTASRLRWKYSLTNDIGGKTGTTQSNRDGWFIGVTPRLISVNWVGADTYSIRFKDTKVGQGANSALPIFGEMYASMNESSDFNYYTQAKFRKLPIEWQDELNCEPIKEQTIVQKIFQKKELKEKNYEEDGDDEEKDGFLKKLFKKKK